MKLSQEEKKSRKVGLAVSIVLHIVLVAIFLYTFAWTPPNPPPPELGIALSLGTDEQGSGDLPDFSNAAGALTEREEPTPENTTAPSEITSEDIIKEAESDVVAEKTPIKKKAPAPKKQPQKVKKQKKVNTRSLMEGNGKGESNTPGNKGKEQGTPDGRSIYSANGAGGDDPFNVQGWRLNCDLKVNDRSGESGKIIFEIEIDDQGYLTGIKPKNYNVSPALMNLYKQTVQSQIEDCLEKKDANAPPRAKGTLTFILKAK
ncbi:MAG: hypothetical protein ACFB0B_09325 [Thermonemataceae bacterium]